ncbi:type I secretion C-terminal target domain-containing protein, partial [Halomonas saccharevitans]
TATVSLTVDADSEPQLRIDTDPDAVWESALPDGSGKGDGVTTPTTTTGGTFQIDTGSDELDFIEVQDKNGVWIKVEANGTTVQGEYGLLSVDLDGSWTYELTDNTHDHNVIGAIGNADQVQDEFGVRVTDSDGDLSPEATLSIDVNDDGPSITVSVTDGVSITLNTQDAELTDTDTASFASALAVASSTYGADGPGQISSWSYALELAGGDGSDTGLTSGGVRVSLYLVAGQVIGSTAASAAAINGNSTVFSLMVNTTGDVTLTQSAVIDQDSADTSNFASDQKVLDSGLVDLVGTVIVTDGDGDTSSVKASLDLGGNVLFDDDGPSIGQFADLQVTNVDGATDSDTNTGWLSGADGWSEINITGPVIDGISYEQIGNTLFGRSGGSDIFSMTVNEDGTYNFELIEADAGSSVDFSLTGVTASGPTVSYPLGGITVTGSGEVNASSNGLAVDSQNLDDGESLTFTLPEAVSIVSFGAFTAQGGTATITLDGVTSPVQTFAPGGSIEYDFGSVSGNVVTLTALDLKAKIDSIGYVVEILPEGQDLTFQVEGIDGDGDKVTTDINVAIVVDGVVEGMSFATSSGITGVTDEKGAFEYRSGDAITFSVGNVVLGTFDAEEALADGKVFLQEIAGVGLENLYDEYVENMAVFLQSLDVDGDAYNGIVINEGIHEVFSDDGFDLATMSEGDLRDVLLENGYQPLSEAEAMQHVKDMIVEHAGDQAFSAREGDGMVLLASEDDDVFAFDLAAAEETPAEVRIAGFGDEGVDSLDLRDLLQGEEAEGVDLTSYLKISLDGTNTVIEVSSDGSFQGDSGDDVKVDQTIILEATDLVTGDDSATVIQQMIDSGQINIDQ